MSDRKPVAWRWSYPGEERWYLTEAAPSAGVLPHPDAEIEALYTSGNGMTVNVDGDLLVLMLVEWFEKDGWLIEGDDGKTMAIRASGEGPAGSTSWPWPIIFAPSQCQSDGH